MHNQDVGQLLSNISVVYITVKSVKIKICKLSSFIEIHLKHLKLPWGEPQIPQKAMILLPHLLVPT